MKQHGVFYLICATFLIVSCIKDPNINEQGQNELESLEVTQPLDQGDVAFSDSYYVPIYSDIYFDQSAQRNLLAATLSIRNTSDTDSLFITGIKYYNTAGDLVRNYVHNTISLSPMASVNYVVEREDDTGGHGANFIVDIIGRTDNLKPLIQAVMIGQNGNKAFAFTSEAYSLK